MFNKLPEQDVVSWNALIGGHSEHGQGEDVLQLFEQMQGEETPRERRHVMVFLDTS